MIKAVGIFLHGQQGDIMSAMSVLKYREQLWGDAKIVWYADRNNFDLFKFQDIEVREFPRGFGYPEMVVEENRKLIEAGKEPVWEDWQPLVDDKNHMNLELKKNYPSLADIDYGYFPAPHQMSWQKRHGVDYPNCSRKVFGIPVDYPWHPVIHFSEEEKRDAVDYMDTLEGGKKIFFETFAGSSQSIMSEDLVRSAMDLCRVRWPGCTFIFPSHKFLRLQERWPDDFFIGDTTSCNELTVRQCALIADKCDLMISVSSGITVAASAWGIKQPPTIQYCGSFICSTKSLANRRFELVTADGKTIDESKSEFLQTLDQLLNEYK